MFRCQDDRRWVRRRRPSTWYLATQSRWSDKGRSARSRRLRMPRSTRRRSHGPSIALGPTKIQLSPKRLELLALRELDQRRRGACFVFTCRCSDDEGASSGEISPRVATPERQQPPAPQAAPTHRSLARSSRTRIGRGRLKTDNAFALRNLGGHRGGPYDPLGAASTPATDGSTVRCRDPPRVAGPPLAVLGAETDAL